jgi:hypothetical protein
VLDAYQHKTALFQPYCVRRRIWFRRAAIDTEERAMLAKLGHLFYWVGSGLAAATLVAGVFILQHGPDSDYRWVVYVASIGSAVVCWLLGRARKYFLAGE